MNIRVFTVGICAAAITVSAFGQVPYKAPRTPDGHPDFQGVWENDIATPLQRPKEVADRPTLTDAEVEKMRQKAKELFTGKADAVFFDGFYPAVLANVLGLRQGFKSTDGETGDYGSEWNDERTWENRTSLITDPADGREPEMTQRALDARAAARVAAQRSAGPEDRPLGDRCITYGSPQLTAGYQSFYQIVEAPNAVMIMTEMFHDARVVNMDSRPHPLAAVQQWLGDSRGHWEGDTLVVDVTNQNDQTWFDMAGNFHSDAIHVVERYTPVDADNINYEATITDPKVYTKPWKIAFGIRRNKQPGYELMEFACVEGEQDLQHYTESEGAKK